MASLDRKSSRDKMGTKLLHAGKIEQESFKSAVTPIFRATTYQMNEEIYSLMKKYCQTEAPDAKISEKELQELRNRIFYTRDANPNVSLVQRKMAALEGCEDGVSTSSGMAAIASSILSLIKGKKYMVSTPQLYGTSFTFIFKELEEMFGVKTIQLDDFLSRKWKKGIIGHEIACIYVETLSNPFLLISPLEDIRVVRDELCPETPIIADNTLLTPVNFRPFDVLDPERDLVLYSATKYLGGHSEVMAGIVCGSLAKINRVWEKMSLYGCCLDAESAYHLETGLKTLHLRMERHNQNMYQIFQYLTELPERFGVKIFHPLTGENYIPNFARSLVEQKRLGGMVTFNIHGKVEKDGIRFMDILNQRGVIKQASSLGGVESLISMPYNTSQPTWEQQELLGLKQYGCLLRLSVGIEDVEDIMDSLAQAFAEICRRT